MSEPGADDLDTRVARLEREVAQLRERLAESASDSAAARVLASGADRDVSEVRAELRAHVRALNALRETQLELRETQLELRETQLEQGDQIAELRTGFGELRTEFGELRSEMREGFATVNVGMAQISALLANIARDDEGRA